MKYISYRVQWNLLDTRGHVVHGDEDTVKVYARNITSGMTKALKAVKAPHREIIRIEFWEVH